MTKSKLARDDPAQSKRFLELAKELGAEGDAKALEKSVRHLAHPKRSVSKEPSPTPRKKATKGR
jgi:hypothetical protein